METLIYNSTIFLRVTLIQYYKAFGLSATPVALLVPDVNTPPYSHRFKSLIYTKTLDHPVTYITFSFIAEAFFQKLKFC